MKKQKRRFFSLFSIKKFFTWFFYLPAKLVKPKSTDEDLKRREFVFNVIVLSTVAITALGSFILFYRHWEMGENFHGFPLTSFSLVFLLFITLYLLSRQGYFIFASYILVALYLGVAFFTSWKWGADVPQALLVYALMITIASILLGTEHSFVVLILIGIFLITLNWLQGQGILNMETYWRGETSSTAGMNLYVFTLGVITVVSWLSNREIRKSLRRARRSEAALKKERDLLEIRVAERTKELQKLQLEKVGQLYRFAEFGKLASGIFHDLASPLTALAMSIENFKTDKKGEVVTGAKDNLDQVLRLTDKMQALLLSSKKQLSKQDTRITFSLRGEVEQVLQLFSYRARKENIDLFFKEGKDIVIFGNPLKFGQVITNLISNALDSYNDFEVSNENRRVQISMYVKRSVACVEVRDWGSGISGENLKKIFEPLFTTKQFSTGTGVGLTNCKEIIENDFSGVIEVESEEGKGALFRVCLPLKKNTKKN